MKRRLIVAGCVLSIALGCADIYGLGDYTEQEAGLDASTDVSGSDVAIESGSDSGSDVAVESGSDAGSDVAVESGGEAAAPDAGCGGVCVPPVPGGWTVIGYDQAFRPGCAANYASPTDVEEGLSAAPATCGCSCTATQGCSNLVVTAGDGGQNGCNNKNSMSVTWDGGCAVLPTSITAMGESASVSPTGSGGCTPDASVVTPSVTYAYQGRLCQLSVPLGGGCEAGACVPTPAPFGACLYQAGVVACPAGYPAQHVVGTTVNDARGCTACTCGYDGGGACGGSATLYTGTSCNAGSQTITADGTCQAVANQTFKSIQYLPSGGSGTCTPSATSPTGTAGFTDPATVCCTN